MPSEQSFEIRFKLNEWSNVFEKNRKAQTTFWAEQFFLKHLRSSFEVQPLNGSEVHCYEVLYGRKDAQGSARQVFRIMDSAVYNMAKKGTLIYYTRMWYAPELVPVGKIRVLLY